MISRQLRIAQVIMLAQAAASLGIWVVQLLTISARLDHNQDVAGSVWFVIVINPVIAVLVALAAAFLTRRPWARGLALFMEAVGAVSALISVITGFYQALIAILLAIVVMVLVASAVSRFRLAALAGAVVLFAGGCAGPPPMDCDGNFCSTPGYWPSTATQIENGFVAVLSTIGVVPIVPRSANGPARRTIGE